MHGSERREQIIRQIQESKAPVSGTKLIEPAKDGVSDI